MHAVTAPDALTPDLFETAIPARDGPGARYCATHDAAARRPHGITLTPDWLVDAMLDLLDQDNFDTVVDCGAGTGRFALEAAHRMPTTRVVAVEQHEDMLSLLRQRIAERKLGAHVEVLPGDFRAVVPRRSGTTAFIGNPPYVRHHDLGADWKDWFADGMAERGIRASRLAGLHAHFMLRAAQQMLPGDAMCFVTSAEWLDNGYGDALRRLFDGRSGLALQGLWLAEAAEPIFSDALVSGVVVLVRCTAAPGPVALGMVRDRRLETLRRAALAEVQATGRWSELCRPLAASGAGDIEVGEVFRVTRGQVTGNNAIWVLPADQTAVPRSLTVAAVTRAREIIDGTLLTPEGMSRLRRVVDLPADLDRLDHDERTAALRFIDAARRAGADGGYIARHRKPWYVVAMREPPAVVVSYMGRRPPAFRLNPWRASFINIAHGLYPREPIEPETLQRLVDHLNVSTETGSGRVYGGGLAKFEPGDIARLRVPARLLQAPATEAA